MTMKLYDAVGKIETRGKLQRMSLFTTVSRVGYDYRRLVSNWDRLTSEDRSIMQGRIDEFLTEREVDILQKNFRRYNLKFESFCLQLPLEFVIDDVNSDHYRLNSRKSLFEDESAPFVVLAKIQLPRELCCGLSIPVHGMYGV